MEKNNITGLTSQTQQIFDTIVKEEECSVRRLRVAFHFSSNGGIYYHLNQLKDKNLIDFFSKKLEKTQGRPLTFVKVKTNG